MCVCCGSGCFKKGSWWAPLLFSMHPLGCEVGLALTCQLVQSGPAVLVRVCLVAHAAGGWLHSAQTDLLTFKSTTGTACSLGAMFCVAGTTRARLRDMYTEHGDLGDVAQACRQTQVGLSSTRHTVLHVYSQQAAEGLNQCCLRALMCPSSMNGSHAVQAMKCPALGHMVPSALLHCFCNGQQSCCAADHSAPPSPIECGWSVQNAAANCAGKGCWVNCPAPAGSPQHASELQVGPSCQFETVTYPACCAHGLSTWGVACLHSDCCI